MNKEQRGQYKDKLTAKFAGDIAAIEGRMEARRIQFEYENAKDEEKLDELKLQHEGLKSLK